VAVVEQPGLSHELASQELDAPKPRIHERLATYLTR